jgi:hypothetical protein
MRVALRHSTKPRRHRTSTFSRSSLHSTTAAAGLACTAWTGHQHLHKCVPHTGQQPQLVLTW